MTIKQQGGIFGRNPTFNNLDVDGTTDLNSVNATSITATGLTVNAAQNTLLEADQSGTVRNLQISNADVAVNNRAGLYFQPSNSIATSYIDGVAEDDASTTAKRDGSIVFGTRLDGSFADQVKITSQGNIAILNSGNGIDFSATSGTGTSELFDDYEEGTWTPVLTFGGASTGITYSHQTGLYTKIGNVVKFELRIRVSSVGTATGDAKITGLPFSPTSSLNGYVGRPFMCNTSAVTASTPVAIVFDTSTNIDLYETPGSSLTRLNDTDFTTNSYLTITGSYTAA